MPIKMDLNGYNVMFFTVCVIYAATFQVSESASCNAVYTRWGNASCPDVNGTQLIYSGRVGGSFWSHTGGGANYLCMPDDPEYGESSTGTQGNSPVYGTEYRTSTTNGDGPLEDVNNYNVPCAVCLATYRSTSLMIPAKLSCPTSWIREYKGFLMSARSTATGSLSSAPYRTTFICVDEDADVVPSSGGISNGALLYHNEVTANGFVACPPYDTKKELTCVVCTK